MADPVITKNPGTARGCTTCGASNAPDARFCAACGAGLPPLTPPGVKPGSVAALLDTARQHLLLGHWEDAGLAAEAVLTLEPDSAEGHHIAARARLKQGMMASAATHAEQAVELDPGNNEYQATLAEAVRAAESEGPRLNAPAMAASIVAILVFALIAVMMVMGRTPKERRTAAEPAIGPSGAVSPFAQPPASTPLPQPSRTPGVDLNRPRIPGRTAAPPETGTPAGGNTGVATGTMPQTAALPPAQTGPMESALPPAPVDSSPLQRFQEPPRNTVQPQPAQPAQPSLPAPQPYTQPANPPGVVAAPPAQPGGTIFGPAPSTPPRATNPGGSNNPFNTGGMAETPAPAPAAPRQAPTSPAQSFVERDYGGAIQTLSQRIAAGQATGSNYQQLGAAYANVGNRAQAVAAYRNAEAAYRAQIQAGQDVEVARRGLRNTQLQLQMLGAR